MRTMVAEERKHRICTHQHPTMHQACETRLPTPNHDLFLGLQQHYQHPGKVPDNCLFSCTRYLFSQDIHAHATQHTNSPRKMTQAQTHYVEETLEMAGLIGWPNGRYREAVNTAQVLANICQGSPTQQCRRLTSLRVTHFQVPTRSLPGAKVLGDRAPAASYTAGLLAQGVGTQPRRISRAKSKPRLAFP